MVVSRTNLVVSGHLLMDPGLHMNVSFKPFDDCYLSKTKFANSDLHVFSKMPQKQHFVAKIFYVPYQLEG